MRVPVAQWIEQLPSKQSVVGSTPTGGVGVVVQLVRTIACHARGRGFESHLSRQGC